MAELAELLRDRWLVTVTGAPGVGKSRLAAEAAVSLGLPAAAVAVVALASARDPDLVAAAVADALDAADGSREALVAAIADLGARRVVVVLDDCDHVLGAAARVAETLVAAGAVVLATSQRPLGVGGEAQWRLGPLSLPAPDACTLPAVLVDSVALQLFCERAAAVRRGFLPIPDVAPALAEICRRLDGLPLAIELAARRLEALSPAEILAGLDHPMEFLGDGGGAVGDRHASLRGALDWSFEFVPEGERALLRRLSVFPGDFTLAAARELTGGRGLGGGSVLGLLRDLVARSLVEADVSSVISRYRLLHTVRHYARERLVEASESEELSARHAYWCLKLVQAAGDPGQRGWAARLDACHDDLGAALDWALESGEAESVLRLAHARLWLCRARGEHGAARAAVEAALPLRAGAPPRVRGQMLHDSGLLALSAGEFPLAAERLHEARGAAREADDAIDEVRALSALGLVSVLLDAPARGLEEMQEALTLARQGADPRTLADALAASGRVHLLVGKTAMAQERFAESREIAERAGADDALAGALVGLGWAATRRGDYDHAEATLDEGIALARAVCDLHAEAVALTWLGETAAVRGDEERAERRFAEADALARQAATPYPHSRALVGQARLAHARGDLDRAKECFAEALSIARRAHHPYVTGPALTGLGQVARARGDGELAHRLLSEAAETARRCHDKTTEAGTLDELGRLARDAGKPRRSQLRHRAALALRHDMQDPAGLADSIEALAGLAADREDLAAAGRLLGAAHALRAARGCVRPAPHRPGYDADLQRVRQALGDALDSHWHQGQTLTLKQTIATASGSRRRPTRPPTGWDALTPTERNVADLAAQNLTNAAIAERLTVSRRTVETHLHNLYAKLDIRSRSQLATRKPT